MKIALCVGFMLFCSMWASGKWDYDKMKVICDRTEPIVYADSFDNLSKHWKPT